VVAPTYAAGSCFSEGKASVLDLRGVAGFISDSGDLVIPHLFQGLGTFQQGLCSISGGYIDHHGQWFIDPQFLVCSAFSEGRAFASSDGEQFGFIGFGGTFVVPPVFSRCGPCSEGLAAVLQDDRWGYIDHRGVSIIPNVFEGRIATAFRAGRAGVCMDGAYGFIDPGGLFITKPEYEEVRPFSEGHARVRQGGKWGLIDTKGTRVVECQFDEIREFDGGIAPARLDGRAGFISSNGTWLIQPLFEKTYRFYGNLAVTRTEDTFSYIRRTGEVVWTSEPGAPVQSPPPPVFY